MPFLPSMASMATRIRSCGASGSTDPPTTPGSTRPGRRRSRPCSGSATCHCGIPTRSHTRGRRPMLRAGEDRFPQCVVQLGAIQTQCGGSSMHSVLTGELGCGRPQWLGNRAAPFSTLPPPSETGLHLLNRQRTFFSCGISTLPAGFRQRQDDPNTYACSSSRSIAERTRCFFRFLPTLKAVPLRLRKRNARGLSCCG